MFDTNKIHEWVNTALIVVLLVMGLVGNNQSSFGATGTRFPNGLSADSTSPVAGELRGTTLTITGAMTAAAATLSGLFTVDAGTNNSYSLATTTSATTYTLLAADIGNYDTIRQDLTGGATTFTLPASSTITALVPSAGDRAKTCWMPLTNSLIFAAGTGIDIMVATSTNNGGGDYDLTIAAGGVGCIEWFRQTDTDITAGLIEYENAD
jgi:hypothetical protein